MLDVPEISGVLAILRKLRPRIEFKFQGKARDKSFSIEHQGTHLFARLSKTSDPKINRAVKVSVPEAFKLSLLLVEQLVLAHPTLPPDLVIELALSVNEPIDIAK